MYSSPKGRLAVIFFRACVLCSQTLMNLSSYRHTDTVGLLTATLHVTLHKSVGELIHSTGAFTREAASACCRNSPSIDPRQGTSTKQI